MPLTPADPRSDVELHAEARRLDQAAIDLLAELRPDDVPAELRAARLALVYAVAHTLKVGMDLLGINAVQRM